MKLTDQLTDFVNAAFTGVWIQTSESDEAEKEIIQHARQKKWKIAVWDVAAGLRLPGTSGTTTESGAGDPLAALRALPALADEKGTAILVLHNFHRFLTSPEVIQTAFTQLVAGKQQRTFIVVLAPLVNIPVELEKLFVDYFNKVVLPATFNCSYEKINGELLHYLMFSSNDANAKSILDYMMISAAIDSKHATQGSNSSPTNIGELQVNADIIPTTSLKRAASIFEDLIFFDQLPSVAVQYYWINCVRRFGDRPFVVRVRKQKLLFRREKFIQGCPTADGFRQLSLEQFADRLCHYACQATTIGERAEMVMGVCKGLENPRGGMTFSSLQEGLTISPEDVAGAIDLADSTHDQRTTKKRKYVTQRQVKLTDFERQVYDMHHDRRMRVGDIATELGKGYKNIHNTLRKAEAKVKVMRSRSANAKRGLHDGM